MAGNSHSGGIMLSAKRGREKWILYSSELSLIISENLMSPIVIIQSVYFVWGARQIVFARNLASSCSSLLFHLLGSLGVTLAFSTALWYLPSAADDWKIISLDISKSLELIES